MFSSGRSAHWPVNSVTGRAMQWLLRNRCGSAEQQAAGKLFELAAYPPQILIVPERVDEQ